MRHRPLLASCAFVALAANALTVAATPPLLVKADPAGAPMSVTSVEPLTALAVQVGSDSDITVRDGSGRVYASGRADPTFSFAAGGALGRQEIQVHDRGTGRDQTLTFTLDAETKIADGGPYADMFRLFRQGMNCYSPTGVESATWNGRTYHFFVSWGLDHYHTSKGMRYFSPVGGEFLEMMRAAQREDGMIWSNINRNNALAYYRTAYGPFGYVRQYGDQWFVRQPTENHPEYIYVRSIYQWWKTNADDAWMRGFLDSAMRALDYSMTDPARWSQRFGLLKRVYTIDSWDFEVDDAYTPDIGLTNTMLIDPVKSKFGVFFGDNVNYAAACDELAEMLDRAGRSTEANRFRNRGAEIRTRLNALSWNGRFFTHFIDEDPTVKRDLGVDEKAQIAQGNAYALNSDIAPEQAVAIIGTYQDLLHHLPVGSPGEWYAIYPPFQKGFGQHDELWQYMNGGVGGHVAGELARGAFRYGREAYGRDILSRLTALGHAHGDKIWFAYTGSIPPPPPAPHYTPIDLAKAANMDLYADSSAHAAPWMLGTKKGDDIRGLPTGDVTLAGIPFHIDDPAANERRAVVAVSERAPLPAMATVPVHAKAACVYLLHTASKPSSENVCGSVTFQYEDGTQALEYMLMGKQLTYWWFSELKTPASGIAWHGPSPVCADVGVSWCALANPHPDRAIAAIRFGAPGNAGIYTVLGLTLADRPHYVPPSPTSFGGPDNWAAATAMAALVEGMAGVDDLPHSEGYAHPQIAPRWDLARGENIDVIVRYPACAGYVAYRYAANPKTRVLTLTITGSAPSMQCHLPLSKETAGAANVTVDDRPVAGNPVEVDGSPYLDFPLDTTTVRTVRLRY